MNFRILIKGLFLSFIIFPIIFLISILASPFYALCAVAGERDVLDKMLDRIGEKIKDFIIEF